MIGFKKASNRIVKSNFCPSCGFKYLKFNSKIESCDNCGVKLKVNFRPFKIWGGCVALFGWVFMISFFTSAWFMLIGVIGMLIGIVGAFLEKSSHWIVDDR